MKTLVTYYSRTGNTKKIAEAIFEEIAGQKELKSLGQLAEVGQYDVIFVGSPIEKHGLVQEVQEFLKERIGNRKVALFITHAAPEHADMVSMYIKQAKELIENPSNFLGIFTCQGELSEAVAEYMSKSGNPQLQKFAGMRGLTLNQPDAERIERGRQFARDVSKKIESMDDAKQIMSMEAN